MYRVVTDPDAADQIAALPDELLPVYLHVLDMLELTPWNGEPYNASNPDAAMRQLAFGPDGRGIVIYLVLEEQRRVEVTS